MPFTLCEVEGMAKPTPTELAKAADISVGYASMLLSGERDSCSLATALKIYDATGLRFGFLTGLTPKEIEPLRRQLAA